MTAETTDQRAEREWRENQAWVSGSGHEPQISEMPAGSNWYCECGKQGKGLGTRAQAIAAHGRHVRAARRAEHMKPATVPGVPSRGRPKEIVRLSEETVAALAARAEAEGVSKSDIMRRAIEKELGVTRCHQDS